MNPISIAVAVLLALAGRGWASPQEEGRARFAANGCAACHKIGARGGTSGPDLTLVGFRRSYEWLDVWLKSPKAWKRDTLMPEFRLRDSERRAIVSYLSSLQGEELDHARLTSGKAIFNRAGCVACHGAGGTGGHPNNNVPGGGIPALAKTAGTFTHDELVKKIAGGVKPEKADPMGAEPLVFMPRWSEKLTETEISQVADYVKTLGLPLNEDF